MTTPNRNFMLQQKPLTLASVQEVSVSSRSAKLVNSYLSIPPFTATHKSWAGASYVVARIPIQLGKNFAIRLPITKVSNTFCPIIRWNEGSIVRRYKLWFGVGERISCNRYIGQVVPDSCTAIEIWSVAGRMSAVLSNTWNLLITELSVPYTVQQQAGTAYDLTTICYAHPYYGPGTISSYLQQCNCA